MGLRWEQAAFFLDEQGLIQLVIGCFGEEGIDCRRMDHPWQPSRTREAWQEVFARLRARFDDHRWVSFKRRAGWTQALGLRHFGLIATTT